MRRTRILFVGLAMAAACLATIICIDVSRVRPLQQELEQATTQCENLKELREGAKRTRAKRAAQILSLKAQVALLEKERDEIQARSLAAFDRVENLERELAARPEVIIEIEPAPLPTKRVVELPEDADKWYVTLFLDSKWESLPDAKLRAAQVAAVEMFDKEPWCVALKNQTHFCKMTIDDPRAVPFYPILPSTPCLLIQRACGEVIYKESGAKLTKGLHGLRRAIQKATKRHCPDGRCPVAWPVPKVETPVKEEPIPEVIEKTPEAVETPKAPEPPPAKKQPNLAPVVFAGALAFLGAVAVRFRMATRA